MTAESAAMRDAGQALARVLLQLADAGAVTPCQAEPAAYYADHQTDLADAAEACQHCPALLPCRRFADLNGERQRGLGRRVRTDRSSRRAVAS